MYTEQDGILRWKDFGDATPVSRVVKRCIDSEGTGKVHESLWAYIEKEMMRLRTSISEMRGTFYSPWLERNGGPEA